jgi:diphosphomevalonate decarboxylase
MMIVESSAPSNIALIKYMGKVGAEGNHPTNSSLSWTLENLRTFVRITEQEGDADRWAPLERNDLGPIELSQKSKDRFIKHFQFLKSEAGIEGAFLIESANNFPSDCGLASSASSFAALTLAATEMFEKIKDSRQQSHEYLGLGEKAELSRQGSGSSCRSFFSPWALWTPQAVRPLEFPVSHLMHQVVVVEAGKKSVSSSEAHNRVTSSALFQGRIERAEKRLADLMQSLRDDDWPLARQIVWEEFWDMHALFETSRPSFGYMTEKSLKVLRRLDEMWKETGDGPLVTMDAGANVHLLYRPDQKSLFDSFGQEFRKNAHVFSNSGESESSST